MANSIQETLARFNDLTIPEQQDFVRGHLEERDVVLDAANGLSGDIYYQLCEAFRAEEQRESHNLKFN